MGGILEEFEGEAERMRTMVDAAGAKSALSLPEIVGVYHQVIKVSMMIKMLRQQAGSHGPELDSCIRDAARFIPARFDAMVHPRILAQLESSIRDAMSSLREDTSGSGSESDRYDELRRIMSTKEFVVQYSRGLD